MMIQKDQLFWIHTFYPDYESVLAVILHHCIDSWVKVITINFEFRILRLTFHRKSASKCWIRDIIAYLINFEIILTHLNMKLIIFVGILQV